jgi:hypothetical protein
VHFARESLQSGDVKALLIAEVIVEQALCDARLRGDLINRDFPIGTFGEQAQRDVGEFGAALSRALGCRCFGRGGELMSSGGDPVD